jgi:hypothetical protein
MYNNGGSSISCKPCLDGLYQSLDGFRCVTIQSSDCLNGFETEFSLSGDPIRDDSNNLTRECVLCNEANSIKIGQSCSSCKPILFSDSSDIEKINCTFNNEQLVGGLIFWDGNYQDDPSNFDVTFNGDQESWYFQVFELNGLL